jgi:hypothetical protein
MGNTQHQGGGEDEVLLLLPASPDAPTGSGAREVLVRERSSTVTMAGDGDDDSECECEYHCHCQRPSSPEVTSSDFPFPALRLLPDKSRLAGTVAAHDKAPII